MKKILLVFTIIAGSILLWNYVKSDSVPQPIVENRNTPTPTVSAQTVYRQYLFIPYWSFSKTIVTDSEYSLIYFGVGVNERGIEKNDRGYGGITSFIRLTPNAKERILAVRMLDKTVNAQILKDPTVQKKIVTDTIALAHKHGFEGVLLDYETSAFGFESTTNNITDFFKLFSGQVHSQNLLFYVTLYGDTYFQSRPFDVRQISRVSDKVLVMAYDFSKSRGNPGPNFPLIDNKEYGYDFGEMISDFQRDVDNQKIVVTLGYFGYDWRVNGIGESITSGVPLSTREIEKDFIDSCEYDNCRLERVQGTDEPSIRYVDDKGENHIIWFEDALSVKKKKEFLKSKGILQTASWAYSYY